VIANSRDGVLLLSETAGVHEELGEHALTVHPFDVQQQADALVTALRMDVKRRRSMLARAAAVVRENDVERWLRRQLDDLEQIRPR
jgi:trehalose 6-phosphate synthase